MRISTTWDYFHRECNLRDCERRYCSAHRLLWRDCETAKAGLEGDRDVIGGLHEIYELGDCPECEREAEGRKYGYAPKIHEASPGRS